MAWTARIENSRTDPASGRLIVNVTYYDGEPGEEGTTSYSPGALEFEEDASLGDVKKAIKERAKALKGDHAIAQSVAKLHGEVLEV